jgi:hypothetical protein
MKNQIKKLLINILPYGLINWRFNRIVSKQQKQYQDQLKSEHEKSKINYHIKRYEKIESIKNLSKINSNEAKSTLKGDNYQAVIDYLVNKGVSLHHVSEGSVPEKSLSFITSIIFNNFKGKFNFLHIGNFVGVSLVYLAEKAKSHNPDSLVIGIDPNIPHREVVNPQHLVLKLINECKLTHNVMIVTSYSRLKSVSNDGVVYGKYDPADSHDEEISCENAISNLTKIADNSFHAAFLDGNHEADYLEKEIIGILPLIAPNGYIILDDVDNNWSEIKAVFEKLPSFGLKSLQCDGRVGIAQLS